MSTVIIQGADTSTTNYNADGIAWEPDMQATTKASRLYKISATNRSAGDLYLWVFDDAAGDPTTSVNPVHVRWVPAGVPDTWDLGDAGSLFSHGIYVCASTTIPANPETLVAVAGGNTIILKVETRVL